MNIPNVFAGDSFNLDVNISEQYTPLLQMAESDIWHKLPDNTNYTLNISNSSIVCPSNQCKGIPRTMTFAVTPDFYQSMNLIAFFKLVDDKSNGHFTPKKQALVEGMTMNFYCKFQDIQEDIVKNTTKYICSEPASGYITRTFNNTIYHYTFTATFETPSGHLVLNATEKHENP
jgi:hypothetical protein